MPAPVNALMARADRASSINAEIAWSVSLRAGVSGRIVNQSNLSPEHVSHASTSQSALCPYNLDGTMPSLEQTRIPA